MGGSDFLALFKNDRKLKIKYFLLKKRTEGTTLKLKANRNCSVYERDCHLLNASLFTLKFYSHSSIS